MEVKQPFFARFLETQKKEPATPGGPAEAKNPPIMTLAFPSDQPDPCDPPKPPGRLYPDSGDRVPGPSNPITPKAPSDNPGPGDLSGIIGGLIDKEAPGVGEDREPIISDLIDPNAPKEPSRPEGIIGNLIKKRS